MGINWIDILLGLIVLFGAFGDWLRGFVLSSLDLIRWIAGLILGFAFYAATSQRLEELTGLSAMWSRPLTFVLIVAASRLTINLLAKFLLGRLQTDFHKRRINRVFGVLPGALNGLIAAAIAASLLLVAPFDNRFSEAADNSEFAKSSAAIVQQAEPYFEAVFGAVVERIVNSQIEPIAADSNNVELPFKVENALALPAVEAQMLELVNRERAAHNLKPLANDSELTLVARKHSLDILRAATFRIKRRKTSVRSTACGATACDF